MMKLEDIREVPAGGPSHRRGATKCTVKIRSFGCRFTESLRGQSRSPTRKFKRGISIGAKKLCIQACKFGGGVSTCKQVDEQTGA